MGSLFDGIGGFPLAGAIAGIKPLWTSEIEAAPISITKRHFLEMKHLGDITKINGAEIEPVDIITFGSPCQDLSVAGRRKGLEGERSGLFLHAVRIIKEMRDKTSGKYPTRIIWENVPGAFSSNNGENFRTVIEEIAHIVDDRISIPKPKKWRNAGAVVGDGWSLAWRVLDAQYWGVPQRRKRIFLVADFRGDCAREILFERKGLSGDIEESGEKGEEIAGDVARGFGETGFGYWREGIQCLRSEGENRPSRPSNVIVEKPENKIAGFNGWRSGSIEYEEDRTPCLQATMPPNVVIGVDGHNQNITGDKVNTLRGGRIDKDNIGLIILNDQGGSSINVEKGEISPTLRSEAHDHLPLVYDARGNGDGKTVNTITGDHENRITDYTAIALDCRNLTSNKEISAPLQAKPNGRQSLNFINPVFCMATKQQLQNILEDKSPPIMANDYKEPHCVFGFKSYGQYQKDNISQTRKARSDLTSEDLILANKFIRRLTPLECERLQGFPDNWTEYGHDGKKISDSARYKALGNSVAIPCVLFVLARINYQFMKEIAA